MSDTALTVIVTIIAMALVIAIWLISAKVSANSRKKRLQQNLERLKGSNSLLFIKKFAHRYGLSYSAEDFKNLLRLLEAKGIYLSYSDVKDLIKHEIEEADYRDLLKAMDSIKSNTLDDYVNAFLQFYGENYRDYLGYFRRFLEEKQIPYQDLALDIESAKMNLELDRFQKVLDSGDSAVTLENINEMSGSEFEDFLGRLFKAMGYEATVTKRSGDQGGDIIIQKFGEKTIVQAKRYSGHVGNEAVQEAVASIKFYGADKGMVVTNSKFTESAQELARANRIELVDGKKLMSWVRRYL